jgi:transcriptional regulator with XRE-family HTH domain
MSKSEKDDIVAPGPAHQTFSSIPSPFLSECSNLSESYRINTMSLQKRLNELMEERHVSNVQLSKAVGCKESAVRKWRKGESEPRKGKLLKKVADYFGVSEEYLLFGKGEKPLPPTDQDLLAILKEYGIEHPEVLRFVLRDWKRVKTVMDEEVLINRFAEIVQHIRGKNNKARKH